MSSLSSADVTSETIAGFSQLFEGRQDAYGWSGDFGVQSVRGVGSWPTVVEAHLMGRQDYGCYPMVLRTEHKGAPTRGEWMVKWGCVDLDIKAPGKTRYDFETPEEATQAAHNLAMLLIQHEVMAWTESTKSGGQHVWVFAKDWVSASEMRNMLLWACTEAEVPTTEVNPKNAYLPDHSSLGNFVRLPFPGGLTPVYDGTRHIDGYSLESFVDVALKRRVEPSHIAELASQYRQPMAPSPLPFVGEPIEITPDFLKALPNFVRFVIRDGMGRTNDRSAWLFRVACICKEEGLDTNSAATVVGLADSLHCEKYSNRPDADAHYRKTVERAYA